jgi:uncharacterized membrane protein
MTGAFLHEIVLALSTFLASSVEMVEALTIVLAVGITRGWRSTLNGVVLALLALAVVVAALGPALTLVPVDYLKLVVGTILLIFGLQWLRKAILRSSGYKALHDEDAIYNRELRDAQSAAMVIRAGQDWYAFTLAFKGTFLEGLEVAFIVVTFGSTAFKDGTPNAWLLAIVGAAIAIVLVGAAGVAVHRPLSQVPENSMKFAVGIMLTTFGIFWGTEGVWGVQGLQLDWPGQDLALIGILAFIAMLSLSLVSWLKAQRARTLVPAKGVASR